MLSSKRMPRAERHAVEALARSARRPIPLFNLQEQTARLRPRLSARLGAVLEHGQFILGPEVGELEAALADYVGVRHAVGVSSGRDALIMALMALGVGPDDAVFVPAFTFSATAGAVVAAGAAPVFVDVDPATCNMAPQALLRAIERTRHAGRLTPKAVMPVDLYGLPADYPAIAAIAASWGLTVIADAAQSLGGALRGRRVGALTPVTATSFYPTKPLGAFGDAGAVFTDDEGIAEAVRQIRNHGMQGSGDVAMRLGMTGRLDTLQAAVLLTKLALFDDELAERQRVAARYDRAFRGCIETPSAADEALPAWALYTIRVEHRDTVRERLAQAGVGSGVYYRVPLHHHAAFAPWLTGEEALPISEQLANSVLSLPIYAGLKDQDVDRVAEAVLQAVG